MKTENNNITLIGTAVSECEYSHQVFGEKFYIFNMESKRISGVADVIPVMVSERMFDISNIIGTRLLVEGNVRTHNKHEGEKNRLIITVFATDIEVCDDSEDVKDQNAAEIEGFICKQPIYRKTPLGREITDLLIAVNRQYGKSDYIPCIVWGRNARYVFSLEVGEKLKLFGRLQSRQYVKAGESQEKTAFELSVARVEEDYE